MARHKKRHHKRRGGFGDYVSVPSLGALKDYNPLGKHVSSTDVLVGAALGMAGGSFVKMGLGYADVATGGKIPAVIKQYIGPFSTLLAGVALYVFQRKSKKARAEGHLVGATLAALAPAYWDTLKSVAPQFFFDYVTVSPYGVLTQDDMAGYGVLTQDALSGADDTFDAP
jgi:hypothetical protein